MDDVKKRVEKMRSLAQLDVDAMDLYEAAIARIHVPAVKEKLQAFRVDHDRHVQDLNAKILQLGGERVEHVPDLKGKILRGFTAITSMMGTEAALMAMMGNEELTNRTYQAALKMDWQAEERALIEKNYGDERRHLEWIKQAVKARPWAHESEAHV